uniref:Uncharacterized protein n=1 Tax=Meleagris gallopavo TaxID=9103 RepID=A0A803Y587_MELGA
MNFPGDCHNERKVTCKHPVTGQPSQDNCIFVVNEQTAAAMTSEEKKERPVSVICEATNYNLTSDYAAHPMSPVGRTSRSSKKVHNFGKRSNSIKRNPNAPVVRRGWLYKQVFFPFLSLEWFFCWLGFLFFVFFMRCIMYKSQSFGSKLI